MPRQALVEKRVISRQQIYDAGIRAQLSFHKQLSFFAERLAQVLVEIGKDVRIRCNATQLGDIQPIENEALYQRVRTRVGHHAPHLLLQDGRVVELSVRCESEQLLVGDAAPEEKGEPGGDLVR